MFKTTKYQNFLDLEKDYYEEYLKRISNFFKSKEVITKKVVEDSFFIYQDVKNKQEKMKKEKVKYKTKNIKILKYQDKIIELFRSGLGVQKIENYLKLNHNLTISRMTIDRFLKDNKINRDE
jgi:hypothetical protein